MVLRGDGSLTPGPPAWYEWEGYRWYRNRAGYYQDRTGFLLHRAIWEAHHGAIADGLAVHHRDHNKGNNELSNLALLPRGEHSAHHLKDRGPDHPWNVSENARKGAHAMWAGREVEQRVCEVCGGTYESRATYSRFCGANCRATNGRRERRARRLG